MSARRSDIGPFAICFEEVYSRDDLSDSAIRVYLVLAKSANEESACWPSLETIGAKAGNKKESAVRSAIRELQDAGLIVVRPRYDELGRQRSNEYFLIQAPARKRVQTALQISEPHPSEFRTPHPSENQGDTLRNSEPRKEPCELDPDEKKERARDVIPHSGQFVPPSLEECLVRGEMLELSAIESEVWWLHYETNGWMQGSSPMVSWVTSLRKWQLNQSKFTPPKKDSKFVPYAETPRPGPVPTAPQVQVSEEERERMRADARERLAKWEAQEAEEESNRDRRRGGITLEESA